MTEGNYDDLAALVRHKAEAEMVLLVIIDGKRGSGSAVRVKGRDLSLEEQDEMFADTMRNVSVRAKQRQLGIDARGVKPAPKPGDEIKGTPKLHAHVPDDSEAQRLIRDQVSGELEAVCKRYDVGGAFILVSKDAASWRSVFPSWCGLQPDPVHVLRLRLRSHTPEERENSDSTMHFVAAMREMCSEYANLYGRIWRQAVDALKAKGATVEHASWDKRASRIDPLGGEIE